MTKLQTVAKALGEMYGENFGGKISGRYRIPAKLVAELAGRRRLYEDDIEALRRAMYQDGYVLIDMETFFVVLSAKTFTNYRRANADVIEARSGDDAPKGTLN